MTGEYKTGIIEPMKTPVRQKGKTMSRFRTVFACCLVFLPLTAGCSDNEAREKQRQAQEEALKQQAQRDDRMQAEARERQQQAAKSLGVPVCDAPRLSADIAMEIVLIPAGRFIMGSKLSAADLGRRFGGKEWEGTNALPQREVTISKSFYMGVYEVTQSQWRAVMGTEPWNKDKTLYGVKLGDNYPAAHISWDAASEFCEKLSKITGKKVTLPTGAQWEYA
ncbi:MAG: SUMF1/EgtB/PvdO family nonheme iron enzyme, partial [bacterium]|nr:SUMF1/EgtB/PvdO family nonheme iron enzyme [bacterium]